MFLVALADVLQLLPNYEDVIIEILEIRKYKKLRQFKKDRLQDLLYHEYANAMKLMVVAPSIEILLKKSNVAYFEK